MRRRHRNYALKNKSALTAKFNRNDGIAGVVYILENPGLAQGYYKIGCSRYSGEKRAKELNRDATTGTPGMFRALVEFRTKDCGLSEKLVFAELTPYRRGKWGQEFFEVDLSLVKSVIARICSEVDSSFDTLSSVEKTIDLDADSLNKSTSHAKHQVEIEGRLNIQIPDLTTKVQTPNQVLVNVDYEKKKIVCTTNIVLIVGLAACVFFGFSPLFEPRQKNTAPLVPVASPAFTSWPRDTINDGRDSISNKPETGYRNSRFKFSIGYIPSELSAQGESENGDGQVFSSNNLTTVLRVYGSLNIDALSLENAFNAEILRPDTPELSRQITYKKLKNNWYVVSGISDRKIFYLKCFLVDNHFVTLEITYPESEKKHWNEEVLKIASSFKVVD
ncbi:GIY-YIG nuclease family protein [Undibacterium sp. Ji49W]|uniref:GIY-YIG nuclease family protein n=1 Tax=Undibacterium sp. Ji49W TaxID=3413040 RepID=UPI003BF2DD36